MTTLAYRIRIARQKAGLSKKDIARALQLTPSAVSQWENHTTHNIRLNHFFSLARLLEQDPEWLATGKAPAKGKNSTRRRPTSSPSTLTPEGKAFLHHLRRLPLHVRKVLLSFVKRLSDSLSHFGHARKKPKTNTYTTTPSPNKKNTLPKPTR